ncbi:hypothetical protein C8R43DRAFT_206594 [Mycena crocata]|nr:hypothetical protein C8R43DRAFT_206594 [Mycena crocata]
MHPSLRPETLPYSLQRTADFLLVGSGVVKDANGRALGFKAKARDMQPFLPVFFANLDPVGIPSPDRIHDMQAGGEGIEAVVGAARSLGVIAGLEIPSDAYPDIWKRIWPWIRFIDTYQEYLLEIPSKRELYATFVLLFVRFQTGGCLELVASAPDVRAVVATAWDLFVDAPDERGDSLFHVAVFIQSARKISDTRWLEQYLEGSGGGVENLATMIVELLKRAIWDAKPRQGDRHFKAVVGMLGDLDSQKETELPGQLISALLRRGILRTLTTAIGAFNSVAIVTDIPTLLLGLHVLARYATTPPGRMWISEVLRAGLFRILVQMAAHPLSSSTQSTELQRFVVSVLPPYTLYHSVLLDIKLCLLDVDALVKTEIFAASELFAPWQRFYALVQERLQLLDSFDSSRPTVYKACDNMTCSEICVKSKLQRCSNCLDLYYCSKQCQKVDWRAGHREDCAKFWALRRLPEERQWNTQDRAFLRALIRHDFLANRPRLFAQEIAMRKEDPTQLSYVVFDYMRSPRSVNLVHWPRSPGEEVALPRAVLDRFHDHGRRAAMSGLRLDVHLMVIPNGLQSHWKVVPMRSRGSDLSDALQEVVRKTADMRSDDSAFEAKVAEEVRPLMEMELDFIYE